jgi:hypothetical protein
MKPASSFANTCLPLWFGGGDFRADARSWRDVRLSGALCSELTDLAALPAAARARHGLRGRRSTFELADLARMSGHRSVGNFHSSGSVAAGREPLRRGALEGDICEEVVLRVPDGVDRRGLASGWATPWVPADLGTFDLCSGQFVCRLRSRGAFLRHCRGW